MEMKAMVAMCNGNRGIGYNGGLPWPHIEEDIQYYIAKVLHRNDPSKKNLLIMGRLTWESGKSMNQVHPAIRYIIVSKTMRSEDEPVFKPVVVKSFEESILVAREAVESGEVENVWIMGGGKVYEDGIKSGSCTKVYVTRVYKDFPSDAFMPTFEDLFVKTSDPAVDGSLKTDPTSGIQYQFEVYTRR